MKKTNSPFFIILMISTLFLSGCSFLLPGNGSSSENEQVENITDFDFVTDDKLEYESEKDYYSLNLYANDKYQIKTTIDDSLGDSYYLKYTTSDNDYFSLTESGYVEMVDYLENNTIATIYAELYKKDLIEESHVNI